MATRWAYNFTVCNDALTYTYTKQFNVWIWFSFFANNSTGFPLITMNNEQWLGPVINRYWLRNSYFQKS